jgi:hypothetical protein
LSNTVTPSNIVAGDTWACSVSASDGTASGPTVTSGTATVIAWSGPRNFTNCSQSGNTGPSQAQCNTAYTSTTLAGEVTVSDGFQAWTVPVSGTYSIEAYGAQGGGINGGLGARMRGNFALNAGTVLNVMVGQRGPESTLTAGGGGASAVWIPATTTPLVIAGGGGGVTPGQIKVAACDGQTGQDGQAGQASPVWENSCGGTGGNGGCASDGFGGAGSGGAWLTNAGDDTGGSQGLGRPNGWLGGAVRVSGENPVSGGFGGGGGASTNSGIFNGGGGGGGYSGGGAGTSDGGGAGRGGGGGSFNGGTSQSNTAGARAGHGLVIINYVSP